jgi:enediyne core biosynthesis thioesterase
MRAYEYQHVVGFEETNLVGNVYYTNHVLWQGRCREMFLREHSPEIAAQLQQDLRLVTTHCSCQYLAELMAFDLVIIRMRLNKMTQNGIDLGFEYLRRKDDELELVARGEQKIVCMQREENQIRPIPIPESLRQALQFYA